MRAHGIGDDSWHVEDDDPASDWEDKLAAGGPTTKRMYALRTNPNRLKSCRVCQNCGKEFLSWKSFLEHGKCTSDADSPVSSRGSDGDIVVGDDCRGCGWSKRKRSFRSAKLGIGIGNGNFNSVNCPSSEEEDLANCLMMLSNAAASEPLMAEPEESCASASRDEEIRRNTINNFIAPMSYKTSPTVDHHKAKAVAPKGLFECKACKKVFNSHQALGGHRASHKKVKGCFASRLDHLDDVSFGADDDVITHEEFLPTKSNYDGYNNSNSKASLLVASSSSKKKSKVHECSICHRTFSSGQALGGHKRCHWITSNAPDTSALAKFQRFQEQQHNRIIPKFDHNNNNSSEPLELKLDLNFPAPVNDLADRRDISTEIYLQPWIGTKENDDDDNNNNTKNSNNYSNSNHRQYRSGNDNVEEDKNNNNSNVSLQNVVEDEADSKVKLAKLSELKDMNVGGSSSPWLQVGIGSTTGVGEP